MTDNEDITQEFSIFLVDTTILQHSFELMDIAMAMFIKMTSIIQTSNDQLYINDIHQDSWNLSQDRLFIAELVLISMSILTVVADVQIVITDEDTDDGRDSFSDTDESLDSVDIIIIYINSDSESANYTAQALVDTSNCDETSTDPISDSQVIITIINF